MCSVLEEMIIARESAAGLETSTDLTDILSNAVPTLGTECLRSPVKELDIFFFKCCQLLIYVIF